MDRVTVCPSLNRTVLAYDCCVGLIMNSAPFLSPECPSLNEKL